MRIAITGATGLLGSNLLLEIIKNNLSRLEDLEIILFGRQKKSRSLERRVRDIVAGPEGLAYLELGDGEAARLEAFITERVRLIDYDLDRPDLGLSSEDLEVVRSRRIDLFFHIASMTDFRSTPVVEQALHKTNYDGTKAVLGLVKTCKVGEYVHVGTAYSCGYRGGKIPLAVADLSVRFRNAYERVKLKAEMMVREECAKAKIRLRVFRPVTICGRLMEKPYGAITKFDVFYSWGAFLLRMKAKAGVPKGALYETPASLPLRVVCSPTSGLNIVPADYAAKVMYQVCIQNDPGGDYYLANNDETPHHGHLSWTPEFLNLKLGPFVPEMPGDLSDLERFHYKTVGLVLTPYTTSEPMLFDLGNLERILSRAGLRCPVVDKKNFMALLQYAKQFDFGLKERWE
ncbi:MAG: NAD-dependent epimerase/dehydratase family protein [Elusimicrobia bacterium]|nr:NAD-dependent epimerase/dehydratase family protein [Elusimicrobiota bacterium]